MSGQHHKANVRGGMLCFVSGCILAPGFLIAALVTRIQALKDARGGKTREYNEAVFNWTDGGGYTRWHAAELQGRSTRQLHIDGVTRNNGSALQPWLATDDMWPVDRRVVLPPLVDDYTDDLLPVNVGLIWVSTLSKVHRRGQPTTAGDYIVRVDGKQALPVPAFKCATNRNIGSRSETKNGKTDNWREEIVSAHRQWLVRLDLVASAEAPSGVASVADGSGSCALGWRSKPTVWTTRLSSATADDDSQELAAEAKCVDTRPPWDLDLRVTVRSPHDPHVVAGSLSKCSYDFGDTKEELERRATLFAWVGLVCVTPILLVAAACGALQLKHCFQRRLVPSG